MLLILHEYKFLVNLLGLNLFNGSNRKYQFAGVIFMVVCASVISMSFGNFLLNTENLNEEATNSIITIFACLMAFIYTTHILFNRVRFSSMEKELEDIVNERILTKKSNKLYADIEQRFTFYMRIIVKTCGVASIVGLYPFVFVAYQWCVGKYTLNSWVYHLKLWTPFAVNTPFRCIAMALTQMYCIFYCIFIFCTVSSLFAGFIMYASAALIDVKSIFNRVDRKLNSKKAINEMALLKYCKEAIDLHVRIYSCLQQLADVMNMIIFSTVTPCIFCICTSLFAIETYDGTAVFRVMQMPIVTIMNDLVMLYFFFYFGQMLHSNLIGLSDMIYSSDWYRYPRCVQRFILLMVMRTQRPFYINAYGIMRCNLEVFVAVLKSISSAFMLLRSFEQ